MKKMYVFIMMFVLMLSISTVAMAGCEKHPDAGESFIGKDYWWFDEPWNENYHIAEYSDEYYCDVCGDFLYQKDYSYLEPHYIIDGKCMLCDYIPTDSRPTAEELQHQAQRRCADGPDGIVGKTATIVYNGNLRAEASQHAADLGAVITDEEYSIMNYAVTEDQNVWLEVKHADSTAWISASLAKISGNHALYENADFYINRTCRIKVSSGRARIAPGTNSHVIAYVGYNEKYTILDCQPAADNTFWFKIKVDDTVCWVSSSLANVE